MEIEQLTSEYIDLRGLAVEGDFRVYKSNAKHVSLANTIVIGSVVIVDNSVDEVTLKKLWIGGDLVLKGNHTSGLHLEEIRSWEILL